MNLATEKLGQWLDQFIKMEQLSFEDKILFFDELIQYYADPSKEEYEKCRTLKRMNELLYQRHNGDKVNMSDIHDVASEATSIIYYLICSIQTEINERVESLKKALTTNGK